MLQDLFSRSESKGSDPPFWQNDGYKLYNDVKGQAAALGRLSKGNNSMPRTGGGGAGLGTRGAGPTVRTKRKRGVWRCLPGNHRGMYLYYCKIYYGIIILI